MPTTAIVIGGSLAGMCAARVLSDFVDAVMIIERDAYLQRTTFDQESHKPAMYTIC